MLLGATGGAQTPQPPEPFLPDEVMTHVDRALRALAMTRDDARFTKDVSEPRWVLSWVTNTLTEVWTLPSYAEEIQAAAMKGDASSLWSLAGELMEVAPVDEAEQTMWPVSTNAIDGGIDLFLQRMSRCAAWWDKAVSGVATADRVYMATALLSGELETEDVVANRAVLETAGMPRSIQERVEAEARQLDGTATSLAWLALVQEIDRAALLHTAREFQSAVQELSSGLAGARDWPDELLVRTSRWGRIVIGTPGDDRHEGPAFLVIDPAGDDTYSGAIGAANGLHDMPFAAIIDLAGDDHYDSDELLGVGAALWGIAVVMDEAGNDTVRGAFMGAGASLYGAAWYEDHAGDDTYRHRVYAQGAGIAGFAFHLDHSGNDVYEVGLCGQAYSGVMGWGLLLDAQGNDRYLAGNWKKDHERNDDRYLSLSQGFSIGLRPHAGGGVAALVDLAGNDTYVADIYGQGVSYYYSAGFLLDASGNDRYAMYQYGQGCGIHLSLGLLADGAGDDHYDGYILSQGAAHDYAVGMFFEQAGNDTYTADHHAQGRALNNAFALLVDRAGEDAYFGRQRAGSQGIGNSGGDRDYGSLALLLDLGGTDIYSGGFSNNVITLRPLYGAVYDHGAVDE